MEKRGRNGRPSERKIEKRQQEEEENVPLSGGARLLFQRGFAISTLATRFFTRYRLSLLLYLATASQQ